MNDQELKRLIESGLQAPTQGGGEPLVTIVLDGNAQQVPASIGTYIAVSNVAGILQQLMLRLDAIHHHVKAGAGSNSRKTCLLCVEQTRVAHEMMKNAEAPNPEQGLVDNLEESGEQDTE